MQTQNQDQPSPYDFPAYDKASATPIDPYGNPGARPRDTQDYIEPAEQEFVGWPVLPEGPEEEEAAAGSGRGGLFLRIGLILALVGVVSFWAYYFIGDFITKRRAAQKATAVQTADSSTNGDSANKPASPGAESQSPPAADEKTPPSTDQPPEQSLPPNTKSNDKKVVT